MWYFMDFLMEKCRFIMFVGSVGMGKIVLVGDKFVVMDLDNVIVINVFFNYYIIFVML